MPRWALLIALALLGWGSAVEPSCESQRSLEEYLLDLELEVAEVNFSKYSITGSVSSLRCSALSVTEVSSASASASTASLLLGATGIGVTCVGQYSFALSIFPWLYGSGEVTVQSDTSALSVLLRAEPDGETGFVRDVTLASCVSTVALSLLSFSGGFSSFVLNLLTSVLRPIIISTLEPKLCEIVQNQLDQLHLPAVFGNLTARLQQYESLHAPELIAADSAFSWPEVPLGRAAVAFNAALANPELVDLRSAVRSLTRALGPGEEGALALGDAFALNTSVPGIENSSLLVRDIVLHTLDSISRLQLARPAGVPASDGVRLDPEADAAVNRTGLVLEIAFDQLSVSSGVLLQLGGVAGPCVQSDLGLSTGRLALSALAQLPLLPNALDALDPERLLTDPAASLRCLLASVDLKQLSLVRLRGSVALLALSLAGRGSRLWADLASALDNVVDMLVAQFGGYLLAALEDWIAGPLSELLAGQLRDVLLRFTDGSSETAAQCVPMGPRPLEPSPAVLPAPEGVLDWGSILHRALGSNTELDLGGLVRLATPDGSGALELMPVLLPSLDVNVSIGPLGTLFLRLDSLDVSIGDALSTLQLAPATGELPAASLRRLSGQSFNETSALVLDVGIASLAIRARNLTLSVLGPSAPADSSPRALSLAELIAAPQASHWLLVSDGALSVSFDGVGASVAARLPIRSADVSNLTLGSLLSTAGLACVLAAIEPNAVALLAAGATFGEVATARLTAEHSALWDSISPVLAAMSRPLLDAATPTLRGLVGIAGTRAARGEALTVALQSAAARLLNASSSSCVLPADRHSPSAQLPQSLDGKVSLVAIASLVERALSALGEELVGIVNGIVRKLTDSTGVVDVSGFAQPIATGATLPACLGVLNLTVVGMRAPHLDSFTELAISAVQSQEQSLGLRVALAAITLDADLTFAIARDSSASCRSRRSTLPPNLEFTVRFSLALERPELNTTIFAAFDAPSASEGAAAGGGMTLGSLVSPGACSGGDGSDLALPQLQLTALRLDGLLTGASAQLLATSAALEDVASAVALADSAIKVIVDSEYGSAIVLAACELLPQLDAAHSLLGKAALRATQSRKREGAVACNASASGVDAFTRADGLVEWAAYPPLKWLDAALNDYLGVDSVDAIIRALLGLRGESDVLTFGAQPLSGTAHVPKVGDMQLQIGGSYIRNLDTLSKLQLLKPVSGTQPHRRRLADGQLPSPSPLSSALTIGGREGRALGPSTHVRFAFAGAASSFALALRLALELAGASLAVDASAHVDAHKLHAVSVRSLVDGTGWACLGASAEQGGVRILSASAGVDSFRAGVSELWAEGNATDGGANLTLAPLASALRQVGDGLTPLVNGALAYAVPTIIVPLLNGALENQLQNWREQCATGKSVLSLPKAVLEVDLTQEQQQIARGLMAALAGVLCLLCLLYARWWRRWRVRTRADQGARLAAVQVGEITLEMPPATESALPSKQVLPTGRAVVRVEAAGAWSVRSWPRATAAFGPAARALCRGLKGSLASEVHARSAVLLTVGIWSAIGLFVWTNLQVSAELVLRFTSPLGVSVQPEPLYKLSLAKLLHDLSKRGPTPVGLVIALLSGVWPVAKLVGVLGCWLIPSSMLPPDHRGALLTFLHANGKWALVDIAIIELAMVAFNLQLSAPAEWLGGISLVTLSVYVLPGSGLYGLLFGTVFSILLSHFALAHHTAVRDRKRLTALALLVSSKSPPQPTDVQPEEVAAPAEAAPAIAELEASAASSAPAAQQTDVASTPAGLGDCAAPAASALAAPAALTGKAEPAPAPFRRREPLFCSAAADTRLERAKLALALMLLPLSITMIGAGAAVDGFEFRISGLAGLLAGEDMQTRSFSLISLGLALPAAMAPSPPASAKMLLVLFFLHHLVMPLALPVAVALLWVLPLEARTQRAGYLFVQMVNAVSGVDIFMLALIVGMNELERLGQFVLHGKCDEINRLLEIYALELLDGDGRCFSVAAKFEKGFWVLLAASVLAFGASRLVLRRCELALAQRCEQEYLHLQRCKSKLAE